MIRRGTGRTLEEHEHEHGHDNERIDLFRQRVAFPFSANGRGKGARHYMAFWVMEEALCLFAMKTFFSPNDIQKKRPDEVLI